MEKKFIPIYFLNFVNVVGFTLLIPVLPSIVGQFSESQVMYGLVLSTYPLFQFIGAPILGSWSDAIGRRPVLIISQLGTLLSWFIFLSAFLLKNYSILGVSVSLSLIILSRIIDGITGGNFSVANAYVTDIVAKNERSKIFANIGVIFGLGFVVGPALGGISASTSLEYMGTIILAIAISFVTLLSIIFFLPESIKNKKEHTKLSVALNFNIFNNLKLIKNTFIYKLLLVRLYFSLIFAGFSPLLVLFLENKFNMKPSDLGVVFLILGLFILFNQGFASKLITSYLKEIRAFIVGILITLFGIVSLSFINSIVWFYILMFLISLGNGLVFPNFKALLSNNSDQQKLGLVNGLDESILAISNVISPMLVTFIYTKYTFNSFWIYTCLILILGFFSFFFVNKLYFKNTR